MTFVFDIAMLVAFYCWGYHDGKRDRLNRIDKATDPNWASQRWNSVKQGTL